MRLRNAVVPFLLLLIAGASVPVQASSGIYQAGAHTLFYLPLDGPDAGAPEGCTINNPGLLTYIQDRFGNANAAVHVAGTGSASDNFNIYCGNTKIAGSSSQDFTVGYWINISQGFPANPNCGDPNAACDYRNLTILPTGSDSGCQKYLVAEVGGASAAGAWPRACGAGNANVGPVVSTLSIADGNWHNLIWTFDYTNQLVTFYVDGVQNNQGQLPSPPVSAQNVQAVAGAENGAFALNGDMDDLWVEDHAWSAAEVTQYFGSGTPAFVSLFAACVNGLQADINGIASPLASVASISWNWGDNSTTTGFFPQSHTYASQGPYVVTVTANYADGSTASASQNVSVASGVLSNCEALTITAGQYGSVFYRASIGSGTVQAGSITTLQLDFADDLSVTADPGIGFSFFNWSASSGVTGMGNTPVNTTAPSISIVVNGNAAINANFTLEVNQPPVPTCNLPLSSYPMQPDLFNSEGSSFLSTLETQCASDVQTWVASTTNVTTATNFLGLSFGPGYKAVFGEISTAASAVSSALTIASFNPLDPLDDLEFGVGLLEGTPEFQTLNPAEQISQQVVEDGVSIAISCVGGAATGGLAVNFDADCVLSLGSAGADATADVTAALQSDPPDPNYLTIFVPQPLVETPVPVSGVSQSLGTAAWGSLGAVDEETMWLNALRVTANRYGTALAYGDTASAGMQYLAFLNYFGLYISTAGNASLALTAFADDLTAQGLGTQRVTEQQIQGGLNFLETQGAASPFVNSFFTSLGFSSDQIKTMIQQAEANPPTPPRVTPVNALLSLANHFAASGVHLASSLQSFTFDSSSNQFVATVAILDTGTGMANNVNVTVAVLDGTWTSTTMPLDIGNLAYAGSDTVSLTFPGRAEEWHCWKEGRLGIVETYTGGIAVQILPVKLPCNIQ